VIGLNTLHRCATRTKNLWIRPGSEDAWVYPVSIVAGNITISPTSASLTATQTQQFTATVTNQSSTALNWSINPQVGTISNTGLYTAPATVPGTETVTITATSQANSALSAWATVTLSPSIPYNLNLPNMTILSGTNLFEAMNNITATSGFTIGGSASVTFTAGNQIVLGRASRPRRAPEVQRPRSSLRSTRVCNRGENDQRER